MPRWYTEGMQEVYKLVRNQGAMMTFMIDDQANWARTEGQARVQCEVMVHLLAALGFYLRPDKCQLRPVQRLKFLGLEVDTMNMKFWVPQDKLDRIVALADRLLHPSSQLSDRDLARLAGKLLACTLAVDIAPLLARGLYLAMVGKGQWDQLRPSSKELRSQLRWCVSMLQRYNGTRLIKREASLIIVGDASDVGAGAFTPNGELQQAGLGNKFLSTWNLEQLRLLREAAFSSTVREVLTLLQFVDQVGEDAPHLLAGRRGQYRTDSQPAWAVINGQAGNPVVYPYVRQLWERCKQLDFELEVVWYPREEGGQQIADALSKLPDNTQWRLGRRVMDQLASWASALELDGSPCGRRFSVDLFADDHTHQAPMFFSRHYCPGTSGINAFSQRWDCYWAGGRWHRHFGLCNGPFTCLGRILRKITDERADVALVYPCWPRYWQQLLLQLRQQGVVVREERLDTQEWRRCLFQAGPRVGSWPAGAHKEPRYEVQCAFIVWPKPMWRPAPAPPPH